MRTKSVRLTLIAAAVSFATVSRAAISVGPAGTGTQTFDTLPPAADWSTLAVGSSAATYEGGTAGIDANIKTKAASSITGTLATDTAATPGTGTTAKWNTNGFLQTKPTTVDYVILMATLQNNSGAAIANLDVSYTFAQDPADAGGSSIGHRAFYSVSGEPGCWIPIPTFSGVTAGALSATLALGSWANGATLYILWADDNGSGTEAGNKIDDFSATPGAPPCDTYNWVNFAGSLSENGDVDATGDAARFSSLYGIDINGAENLLVVCDRGASKIKTITLPGGVVTTVQSGLNLVNCVINKVNGNLYFPDITGAGTIYRIEPPYTGAPVPIATQFAFGLGIDSSTDTLYVGGINDNTVYYITNAGGATPGPLTVLAGTGTAGLVDGTLAASQFRSPQGMAVVGSGATAIIYVTDHNNHAIRKIDVAGDAVTTVAGGSQGTADGASTNAQFSQPHNCVLGPDGNLYVCDQDNYTVRKVTLPDGEVTTVMGVNQNASNSGGATEGCGAAALNGNLGQITIDSAGHIYTADRAQPPGSFAHVMRGTPPALVTPIAITSISIPDVPPGPPQYCWTNYAGSLTADGDVDATGDAARFMQIYGIDINGAGDALFVADRSTGKIKMVTVPGAVVSTLASGFSLVELVVNKVNGNVYFPDLNDGKIKKLVPPLYDTATDVTTGTGYGNGLGVDSAADTVYASKTGGNQIYKIENAGTSPVETLFAGNGTAANTPGTLLGCSLNAPMGGWVVGTGASAVLYWADRVPGTIMKLDIAGDAVTIVAGSATGAGSADGTGTAARFDQPHNVAVGPDGNLYVADQQGGTVRKITLPGAEVTTIGGIYSCFGASDGCGTNGVNGQLGQLTVDGAGNIWTGDRAGVSGPCGTAHARVSKGTPVPGTPGGPGSNVQIDFTAEAGIVVCDLKLQSSSSVDGTYADVAATITALGGISYRAVTPLNGDVQFYRIKH